MGGAFELPSAIPSFIEACRKLAREAAARGDLEQAREILERAGRARPLLLGEIHLLRILAGYFEYYNRARCHLSLAGDAPRPRPAQRPELGRAIELPEVGGLHHRYEPTSA